MTALVAALLGATGAAALVSAFGAHRPPERPAAGRWTLAAIGSPASDRARSRWAGPLGEADVTWTPTEVVGAQRLGMLAALGLAVAAPGPGVAVVPLALAVIARGPGIAIARVARRRRRAAAVELPLFLDLLAVATSAGLGAQVAVRRAVEPLSGPLRDELEDALRATDLGRRWREELARVAERLRLDDLDRAVRLLLRTERLGSSLADEMARLAVDVREQRRAVSVDRARAAPVKMLFPLVFLILPAFLLLTVVPVLLTTVASIG